MAQKGDLMTVRPDIRVLDATIRDGGLVNNFMFTDEFINALYRANVKAGIDYMEFGYKASKELFDVNLENGNSVMSRIYVRSSAITILI